MLWLSGPTCYVVLNSGRHCNAERFGAGQNRLSAAIMAFSKRYARVGFVTQKRKRLGVGNGLGRYCCKRVLGRRDGRRRCAGCDWVGTFAIAETGVSAGARLAKGGNEDWGGGF